MIDHINLGQKTYSVTPMNPMEMMETIFTLQPYLDLIDAEPDPMKLMRPLLARFHDVNEYDFVRILAYMYHIPADELVGNKEITGAQSWHAFITGFVVNDIPEMIKFGRVLGIGFGNGVPQ
jgi:hypothetical protein